MNLDKSQKRIAKKVKKGFQGYPQITITYFGENDKVATKVEVGFIEAENSEAMTESFMTETDIREDITVQSTIIKIIDRSGALSVSMTEGVKLLAE